MSISLILAFAVLVLFLISQFGGKLSARNSLVWWMIFCFLFFCVVTPQSLLPLAHALGVELVSNFVLATMILFLAFQAIQESSFSTAHSRRLRDVVTSWAAESFAEKWRVGLIAHKPKVIVCMPCYNEEEHLPTLTSAVKAFQVRHGSDHYQYIYCIVNDGSVDQTRSLLDRDLFSESTTHLSNVGVAAALLTSFKVASLLGAEYVVQCDADGQHPLELIPALIECAHQGKSDLLIGSRYVSDVGDASSTQVRRLGSKIITFTLKLFSLSTNVKDPTSGFRVYSTKARRILLTSMPDDYPEPETIATLLHLKMKVEETSVKMHARQGGVSSLGGIKGARFMIKVISALIGFRLRTLFT